MYQNHDIITIYHNEVLVLPQQWKGKGYETTYSIWISR